MQCIKWWEHVTHTIKTSTDSGAGTDSNIYFSVRQDVGNWSPEVEISELDHDGGSGDGFEKGDVDVFNAYYLGGLRSNINHLRIRKDDSGSGPDWKPEYVELQEVMPEGVTGKTYRFDINEFIEDETVEYGDPYPSFIWDPAKPISLENVLTTLEGNKLVLKTEEGFILDEGIVALLKEKGITLKVEFFDGEKSLGIHTINGAEIQNVQSITVSKDDLTDDGSSNTDSTNPSSSPKTGDTYNNSLVFAGLLVFVVLGTVASIRRFRFVRA